MVFPAPFGTDRDQFVEPARWIAQLPEQLMLGYEADSYADATRGYSVGKFAAGSRAFRAAARGAGKHVFYFAPDPRFSCCYCSARRRCSMP